jgi:hypothetical protein
MLCCHHNPAPLPDKIDQSEHDSDGTENSIEQKDNRKLPSRCHQQGHDANLKSPLYNLSCRPGGQSDAVPRGDELKAVERGDAPTESRGERPAVSRRADSPK